MLVVIAASMLFVTPASATYVHPRGVMMSIYPQDQYLIFWGPGVYTRTVVVMVMPPWYFVPDLMGFDTVTATLTVDPHCYQCKQFTSGTPPVLGVLNQTGQWTNVDGSQLAGQWTDMAGTKLTTQWSHVYMDEENNGAMLTFTFTFTITKDTALGYYMLYMNGEADAPGVTFTGFDQWGINVVCLC